jgi:DNA-binding CsgD family transcriptional regulator
VIDFRDSVRADGMMGLSRPEETVYLGLCRSGPACLADLAESVALDSAAALRALLGLQIRGLVSGPLIAEPAEWSAIAPDLAIERQLAQREQSERSAREELTRLLDGYHRELGLREPQAAGLVEVVSGSERVTEVWRSVQAGARESIDVFDESPHLADERDDGLDQDQDQDQGIELEQPAHGPSPTVRRIFERSALISTGRLTEVQALISAGELVAMVPELPFKLAIVDRRKALLPMAEGEELTAMMIVRRSPLLDALFGLFEAQWARAMPIPHSTRLTGLPDVADSHSGDGSDQPERARSGVQELLTMLSAGMTDDAIARQLGVSARTVQRRISELMDTLGTRNRFQAGVQVVRHGLL